MKVLNYIVLSPMIRKTAGVGYQIDSPLSMIRKNCWYWIPNRFSAVHRRLCAGRSKLTKPRFWDSQNPQRCQLLPEDVSENGHFLRDCTPNRQTVKMTWRLSMHRNDGIDFLTPMTPERSESLEQHNLRQPEVTGALFWSRFIMCGYGYSRSTPIRQPFRAEHESIWHHSLENCEPGC